MKVELDVTEHQQWNRHGIWRQSKREKNSTTINTQQKTTNNPQSNLPRLPRSNGSFRSLIKGYLLYKVALSPYVRTRPLLGWLEKLLSHMAKSGCKSRDTVLAGYISGIVIQLWPTYTKSRTGYKLITKQIAYGEKGVRISHWRKKSTNQMEHTTPESQNEVTSQASHLQPPTTAFLPWISSVNQAKQSDSQQGCHLVLPKTSTDLCGIYIDSNTIQTA